MADSFEVPPAVVAMESPFDFDTTVARIKDALTTHGLTVFADIDQTKAAVAAGTVLRPTRLVLFGNPVGGTPIMQANPHAALELPLRAVIWQDEKGDVHVDYQNPVEILMGKYGIAPGLVQPLHGAQVLLEATLGKP